VSPEPRSGLLSGVRVLDLTIWRPGPYATQLLAEIGADVLKVEPPGGDPMRTYPDLFASLNANKRSVVLDLKVGDDLARGLDLAAEADVVVEGFRPGVTDRLGVGYEHVVARNPAVIYCSVSGMGQTGPLAQVAGHDLNYQAWAGSLAPDGGPPVVAPLPIADLAGGVMAAFAICAALVRRITSGEGERIDLAMADVLATWTGAARAQADGVDRAVRGVPGYGTFVAADGLYLALGVLTEDHFWTALCDVLDLDDVRDLGFLDRMGRVEELQGRIAVSIASAPRESLLAAMLEVGVPVAPVADRAEMLDHPHFRERGVATRDAWADPAVGYPIRFGRHPAGRDRPPPSLDEHRGSGFLPR